ncbi:MAG: hypothetical protein BZ138_06875 [Methanosphaera sp. rholeuAM270]|nr:MAG: hypothetical protein BZ138_06875 [Methanosphaera sp. rholeuAM270]
MSKKITNYYKILKVEKDADKETIEVICKHNLEKYDEEKYPKKHKLYHNAYVILTDDEKREKYDKLLESSEEDKNEKITRKDMKGKGRGRGSGRKGKGMGRGRSGRKNNNLSNTLGYVSDIAGNNQVSSIVSTLLGTAKKSSLLTGASLLMGGAVAGKGIQKGMKAMSKGKR